MKTLCDVYNLRAEVITAEKLAIDDFNEIPAPYCATAAMWRHGIDITTKLKNLSTTNTARHCLCTALTYPGPATWPI